MKPGDRDAANLHDMLEVAREARELVAEIQADAFLHDRVRRRALERMLELIGEAARRITPACLASMASGIRDPPDRAAEPIPRCRCINTRSPCIIISREKNARKRR